MSSIPILISVVDNIIYLCLYIPFICLSLVELEDTLICVFVLCIVINCEHLNTLLWIRLKSDCSRIHPLGEKKGIHLLRWSRWNQQQLSKASRLSRAVQITDHQESLRVRILDLSLQGSPPSCPLPHWNTHITSMHARAHSTHAEWPLCLSPALQEQAPPCELSVVVSVVNALSWRGPDLQLQWVLAHIRARRNATAEGNTWAAARLVEQGEVGVLDGIHLHCGVITRGEQYGQELWERMAPPPQAIVPGCTTTEAGALPSLPPSPPPRVPIMLFLGVKLGFLFPDSTYCN